MPGVCLRSWWASLTTAFPFSSSSPMLSSPTEGVGRPSTSRAYTAPRCAKPTSSRASQSTLAPASSTRTGCVAVGNRAPIAARCTPAWSRSSSVLAAITAPVFPAEMKASDSPFFWSVRPTAIEERGLPRIAASGFSPIPTASGASTMSMRERSTPGVRPSAASMSALRPTSCTRNSGGSSCSACAAPSTSTRGALSPPIASSAMRITSVLDGHPLLTLVVAAGRADPVRLLHVSAARARLQRGRRRLVVRAARALLALRCSALRYRHTSSSSLGAGLALEGFERLPPGIGGRRAAAGARVQVLTTPRAQAAAVFTAQQEPRDVEQQFLADGRGEIDLSRVRRQRIGVRIVPGPRVLGKQGAGLGRYIRGHRRQTAPALPGHHRPHRAAPIESPFPRRLQPAGDAHRAAQGDVEPLEQGVVLSELAPGLYRPPGQLPQVNAQHGQRS